MKKGTMFLLSPAVIVLFMILMFMSIFGGTGKSDDSAGSEDIVQVALKEQGTIGGGKYRTWYTGSADGAPWCATFVSWCADQLGYIDSGIMPKFQGCSAGVEWFTARGRFEYTKKHGGSGKYTPKTGDIVFFDWDGDTSVLDHVGIVQFVENSYVVTIEGNSGDAVAQGKYLLDNPSIIGYAYPDYPAGGGDFTGGDNAEIAWNYISSMGYSEEATAGILANLQQESGIQPTSEQSGGPGRGICQWEVGGGRFAGLVEMALRKGKPWTDLEIQLEYMRYEFEGGEATCKYILDRNYGGLENFKKTRDLEWATEAFEKSFERAGIPNMENRIRYAWGFYERFAE